MNKALLTVTVLDAIRKTGEPNPVFSVVYDGFVNGDNENNLNLEPVVSTTANKSSPAGIYNLIVSGASSANYDFKYIYGKLTVLFVYDVQNLVNAEVNVFPNPVTDKLFVSNAQPGNTIIIYNILGKAIMSLKISENEPIDLHRLSSGFYIMKLTDDEKESFVKFIKR